MKGVEISPRDYTVVHTTNLLQHVPNGLGLVDMEAGSVFRVEIIGRREGSPCEVIYKGTNQVVATTALSLSIGAHMLGAKRVEQASVLAPEGRFPSGPSFEMLADRGGATLTEGIRSRFAVIS